MMLGFIYVVLTAKPISIRRLCLLYVVVWSLVRFSLSILRIDPAVTLALVIAATISVLVWVSPIVRTLFSGFALVALPIVMIEIWLAAPHALMQAAVIRVVTIASVGGLGGVIAIQALKVPARAKSV
jgi:hypothetical protein